MAVEYFDMQAISRNKGHSACAKASYNSCCQIKDNRTGEIHNYRDKSGLVFSAIVGSSQSRSKLWNNVEALERKSNACVARSFTFSLPLEFNRQERQELALIYAQKVNARLNLHFCDLAIHEPTKRKKGATAKKNPHGHLLIPDRDKNGKKLRQLSQSLNQNGVNEVTHLRNLWDETVNEYKQLKGKVFAFTMKKKKCLEQRKIDADQEERRIETILQEISIELSLLKPQPEVSQPRHENLTIQPHAGCGQVWDEWQQWQELQQWQTIQAMQQENNLSEQSCLDIKQ